MHLNFQKDVSSTLVFRVFSCETRTWERHLVIDWPFYMFGANAGNEVPRLIVGYCYLTDNATHNVDDHGDLTTVETSVTALVAKETCVYIRAGVWAYV